MHSVIFLLFWIKNDDTETGWNVRITMSIWIVSAETGSLSFVMFWSNSLYIRKPCTIFFYEKVVKWCKIVRWLKTKSEATPFDERFTEYFEDRDTKRMLREINGRKKLNALYKMQKGICPHCGEPITVERGFRIHTEVGADFKEKNVLLHADCHRELLI